MGIVAEMQIQNIPYGQLATLRTVTQWDTLQFKQQNVAICEFYWVHTELWNNEYLEVETAPRDWRGPRHGKVITVLEFPVANTTKGYCSIWERTTFVLNHDRTQLPVVVIILPYRYAACRTQGSSKTSNVRLNRYFTIHYKEECVYVWMYVCYLYISTPVHLFPSRRAVTSTWWEGLVLPMIPRAIPAGA
jgi:hypothetical protein